MVVRCPKWNATTSAKWSSWWRVACIVSSITSCRTMPSLPRCIGRAMTEPCSWDLREAAEHIRARHISSVEYVEALFSHIDRLEQAVQAWARFDRSRVLSDAARCDN